MKLKYYLRGLGIGIVVTVIIMMIAGVGQETEMTEDEIIARAEELGMVKEKSKQKEDEQTSTEIQQEIEPEMPENTTEQEYIVIEVASGEYSDKVSQKVFEANLVKDAELFNDFLIIYGYDSKIFVGQHKIPVGSSMEDIAEILCERPVATNNVQ